MSLTQEQLAKMRADAEAGKRDAITGTLLALVCEHVLTLVYTVERMQSDVLIAIEGFGERLQRGE